MDEREMLRVVRQMIEDAADRSEAATEADNLDRADNWRHIAGGLADIELTLTVLAADSAEAIEKEARTTAEAAKDAIHGGGAGGVRGPCNRPTWAAALSGICGRLDCCGTCDKRHTGQAAIDGGAGL